MAVDWNLGRGGFDAMEALQVAGQAGQRALLQRREQIALAQQARNLQSAQDAAGQLRNGDYAGATAAALGSGNFDLAEHIGKLHEDHRKQLATQSDVMGRAAFSLRQLPAEQRAAAFQQIAPQLIQAGLTPEELQHADLSDAGLNGYISLSQDIGKQLEAQYKTAQVQNLSADNARADMLAQNTIANTRQEMADRATRLGLARNADARAAAARSEGHVRFKERDKDRAAIAAGGRMVPTSTDDLNY